MDHPSSGKALAKIAADLVSVGLPWYAALMTVLPRLRDAASQSGAEVEAAGIQRDIVMLAIMYDHGTRAYELCGMDFDSVIVDTSSMDVANADRVWLSVAQRRPDRQVLVSPELSAAVQHYLARVRTLLIDPSKPSERALWVTEDGDRLMPSSFFSRVRRHCQLAGIDPASCSFVALRRNYALSVLAKMAA